MKKYSASDDSRVAGSWWVKADRADDFILFEIYPVEPGETSYLDFERVHVPNALDEYLWRETRARGWGLSVDYSTKYHQIGMSDHYETELPRGVAMEELKHALAPFVLREG